MEIRLYDDDNFANFAVYIVKKITISLKEIISDTVGRMRMVVVQNCDFI